MATSAVYLHTPKRVTNPLQVANLPHMTAFG